MWFSEFRSSIVVNTANNVVLILPKGLLNSEWGHRLSQSDLNNFANTRPSASNFKSSSRSLELFFSLTVGQNNFGNKITSHHIFLSILLSVNSFSTIVHYIGQTRILNLRIFFLPQKFGPCFDLLKRNCSLKIRIDKKNQSSIFKKPAHFRGKKKIILCFKIGFLF